MSYTSHTKYITMSKLEGMEVRDQIKARDVSTEMFYFILIINV